MTTAATYQPSGILLRTLRLERWLCPACSRDNLVRRNTVIICRPCRWCGADLLSMTVYVRSIGEQIAAGFAAMVEAIRRAAESFSGFARALTPREDA